MVWVAHACWGHRITLVSEMQIQKKTTNFYSFCFSFLDLIGFYKTNYDLRRSVVWIIIKNIHLSVPLLLFYFILFLFFISICDYSSFKPFFFRFSIRTYLTNWIGILCAATVSPLTNFECFATDLFLIFKLHNFEKVFFSHKKDIDRVNSN